MEEHMNNMPIDYEQSITDTVKKISDFYIEALEKKAGKMSVGQYEKLLNTAKSLVSVEKLPNFYKNYGWMGFDFVDLFMISPSVRTTVENFFGCVQEYKKMKDMGLRYLETEEKNLANAIKKVNIKFGNELFATFKELFLGPERFLTRVSK